MEIILLERVEKLGQMGKRVQVKDGYARNYLLPQGKALRATKANLERFENERGALEKTNLEQRKAAEEGAAKLEDSSWVLIRQASENLQLYGSVNARDIAEAVSESGVPVKRQQIQLASTIKLLGIHRVQIALHPEVSVEVTINVARTPEEAELQAKTPVDQLEPVPAEGEGAPAPPKGKGRKDKKKTAQEGSAPDAEPEASAAPTEPGEDTAGETASEKESKTPP